VVEEKEEMQMVRLLPEIHQSTNHQSIINMAESIRVSEQSPETKELRAKRLEILKRFMNKKIMLTVKDSVQELKKLPYIKVEEMSTQPKFKVGKVGGRRVPEYLKEDFPSKMVHNAREYVREMNDSLPVSPTALEYTAILDNFTLIRGVPSLNPRLRKKKRAKKD
jgi:aspartyl/asparaginyl-tRNA synthetase